MGGRRRLVFASALGAAVALGACSSGVLSSGSGGGRGGGGRGGATAGIGGSAEGGAGGVAGSVDASGGQDAARPPDDGDAGDAQAPPRQIGCGFGLMPCAPDGSCPDGKVCFRLTDELSVCDVAQPIYPDAGCTPACEEGKVCRPGGGGCLPPPYCWETPCRSPADCGEGTVCTPPSLVGATNNFPLVGPGRCTPRSCQSDRDCTRGPNGRCACMSLTYGGCNGTTAWSFAVACVYDGGAL
jgi:hypothetical protein